MERYNSTQEFKALLDRDLRSCTKPTRQYWLRMSHLTRLYWRIRRFYYRKAWERKKRNMMRETA